MGATAGLRRLLAPIVVVATLATIPIVMALEELPAAKWVRVADWAIWTVFLFEYVTLLAMSPRKREFARRTPVNLLVVILSFPLLPAVLGLVRLARLARFLRLLRLAGVTAKGITGIRTVLARRGFLYVAIAAAFLVLAGGTALAFIEPQTVRGRILDGICWALFTVTTVGCEFPARMPEGGRTKFLR